MTSTDHEVDQLVFHDDGFHDGFAIEMLLHVIVGAGNLVQGAFLRSGRNVQPTADLPVHLDHDLDGGGDQLCRIIRRPGLIREGGRVPERRPEFLGEVRGEGGKKQHERFEHLARVVPGASSPR